MTRAKGHGSVGETAAHGDSDRRKVIDPDTRKVIGTVATPRGIRAS
ncbi:hypothetical protein VB780_25910 [Leptolyngbya sp. CCNP1308]|nr:hypothetical protein [Leptolyngbya sp. CCNP1308]MEA5452036.1 hypothetical protein [Leptolyngbya sp. CCNP1308]